MMIDRDVRVPQAAKLLRQIEPGVVVAPVAVVEVAGDEHEIDAALERQIDHPLERPPRRAADPLDGRVLVLLQAPEGAVEVDIGGVQERDRHGGPFNSGSQRRELLRRCRPIDQELLEPPGGVSLGLARDGSDDQGRGPLGGLDQRQAAFGAEDVDRRVEAVGGRAVAGDDGDARIGRPRPRPVLGSTMCE